MATRLEQTVAALTHSGVLTQAEVADLLATLPAEQQPSDGDALLQLLVERERLTAFQSQVVKSRELPRLVFGEYVVLEKIGRGGESLILKGQHRRMKRLVAIKVLSPRAMSHPRAVERFFREAQAAACLSHPHIIAAYDAGHCDGMDYLVMEYVDGSDLGTIVKEHGPLPLDQAVEWIIQAARGLQYAHEEGVVHRDIKPGNLLLDRRGTIKILDMGLARLPMLPELAAEGGSDRLTQVGQVMGTCDYMAPEQTIDSHLVDARADIYALGCTLYRILVGHGPYKAPTFIAMFLAHRESPIPSLCQARPDAPSELEQVFRTMVAKRPEDRFRSMLDVSTALEACLRIIRDRPPGTGMAERVASPNGNRPEPSSSRRIEPVTRHALSAAEETQCFASDSRRTRSDAQASDRAISLGAVPSAPGAENMPPPAPDSQSG